MADAEPGSDIPATATVAMMVVRILVLSISCASFGELVCKTMLAATKPAG
jgi:hypothetical protein